MNRLSRSKRLKFAIAAVLLLALLPAAAWRAAQTGGAGRLAPGQTYAHTNKLISETSPYLLEHAHNPVNWYPWGKEALDLARSEDRPIFLSIGYSACHWCHVMEREDFENEDIARLLNDHFIAIKVDREQRPDIDAQYMLALQLMTRSGGWPMSLFLTPDRKPFYGGTYYPAADFKDLLNKVTDAWEHQRTQIEAAADRIASAVADSGAGDTSAASSQNAAAAAVRAIKSEFDTVNGGFTSKPKFPEAPKLRFLIARYRLTHDKELLAMVVSTLDHIAEGGIYDQLGGGFHRYSTDERWRVPHFEKMLYDQALLVPVYLDAWQLTRKPRYREIAEDTLNFVNREMTDRDGGFWSSIDADSEGVEGKYYLWTPAEVTGLLGRDAPLFMAAYGVSASGDIEGKSVLHIAHTAAELAKSEKTSESVVAARLAGLCKKMIVTRAKRERPRTDDKVLTSWNGLMIGAFARAYAVLGNSVYLATAVRAADSISQHATHGSELQHCFRAGKSDVPGMLEDYACLLAGELDLYDATKDRKWLDQARATAQGMSARFEDGQHGGFFTTPSQADLMARLKDGEDGAAPSSNGLAAEGLARLAAATGDRAWSDLAHKTVDAFASMESRAPQAVTTLLLARQVLTSGASGAASSPVTLRIDPIAIAADNSATLVAHVTIRAGWHINSDHPRDSTVIPTRFTVVAHTGASISALQFPPTRVLTIAGAPNIEDVWTGDIEIRAKLHFDNNADPATLRLRLDYQPCNDRACLTPSSVEVTAKAVHSTSH